MGGGGWVGGEERCVKGVVVMGGRGGDGGRVGDGRGRWGR